MTTPRAALTVLVLATALVVTGVLGIASATRAAATTSNVTVCLSKYAEARIKVLRNTTTIILSPGVCEPGVDYYTVPTGYSSRTQITKLGGGGTIIRPDKAGTYRTVTSTRYVVKPIQIAQPA